jgi:hypothetical protein
VASVPADVTLSADPTPDWVAVYLSGLTPNRRAAAPAILAGPPFVLLMLARWNGGRLRPVGR